MKLTVCAVVVLTLGVAAQERETSYTPLDFPGAAATTIDRDQCRRADRRLLSRRRPARPMDSSAAARRTRRSTFPVRHGRTHAGSARPGKSLGAYRMPGEPDVNQHGYRLGRDGQFSRIDFPGHVSTVPVRLLPDGTIVGCYHDAAGMDSMHGMTFVKNAFSGFDRAMTMHEGATPDGKTIVGYFTEMTDMRRNRGYVLEGTNFTPFDVPGSVSTTRDRHQRLWSHCRSV